MKGIDGLEQVLQDAVQQRVNEEARARRGRIQGGKFISGARSSPYIAAVDANLNGKVWAQMSPNGNAIIIGD